MDDAQTQPNGKHAIRHFLARLSWGSTGGRRCCACWASLRRQLAPHLDAHARQLVVQGDKGASRRGVKALDPPAVGGMGGRGSGGWGVLDDSMRLLCASRP